MEQLCVKPIGRILINENGMFVKVEPQYTPALKELDGFSHLNIFWWFSNLDNDVSRRVLEVDRPYRTSPAVLGTFATRSPQRPNPIALTVAQIIHIDHKNGMIQIGYTDADDGSPVIDLKPYTPSLDRVENPSVPEWCRHWPRSLEESADFDWDSEMN